MRIKILGKVLFFSTFFFYGCSVNIKQLDADIIKTQSQRWKAYTLKGKATIWEEGRELHQKFFARKDGQRLLMLCYGGGVLGMTPTPTFSVEVLGEQISYRTKTSAGVIETTDSHSKCLYAVIYALSRLGEVYARGSHQIGDATIKVDEKGNPVKISSGSVKLLLEYEAGDLESLEIFFGWQKFLLVEEIQKIF